ncbi:MAG: AAA family ATPase, partial [Myxococcota bacterium]
MASSEKPFPISPALTRILDAIRLAGLPVLLVGSHGIGKSQFLEGYAHSRGLVPHVLDLSLLEATDLTGIPYIEAGKTRFAPPITLPDSQASAPAMLVLEELNRCDRSVRQPCLQLLTARRLNDYRLPANCFLAACINPADKDYQVDALDPALASRFVSLKVRPDRDAWLNWARDHDVHPGVVRFIAKFSQAFDRAPPRTWTHAARLLSTALQQGWQIKEVESLLQPLLGAMTAR